MLQPSRNWPQEKNADLKFGIITIRKNNNNSSNKNNNNDNNKNDDIDSNINNKYNNDSNVQ